MSFFFYFSWFNLGAYKARCRTFHIDLSDRSDILDPSPQTHAVGERLCYSQSQLPTLASIGYAKLDPTQQSSEPLGI